MRRAGRAGKHLTWSNNVTKTSFGAAIASRMPVSLPVSLPASLAAAAVGLSLLASVGQAQAQGRPHWCNSQGGLNMAERTICATRSLWDLDYQLNIIYQSALNSVGAERSRLVRTQEDWVRVTRNGCNEDDTCLADVYERRIAILRSIDNRGSIEPNGIH
jgi:uncharacterized protein